MNVRGVLIATAAATAVLMLSACASGTGYADLERAATADDAWPSSLPEYAAENLDPESSRLVGFDGSTALYLAESTEPSTSVCLLVYPEGGENWVIGCGSGGLTVGGGGNPAYYVRADAPDDNVRTISDNVFAAS